MLFSHRTNCKELTAVTVLRGAGQPVHRLSTLLSFRKLLQELGLSCSFSHILLIVGDIGLGKLNAGVSYSFPRPLTLINVKRD